MLKKFDVITIGGAARDIIFFTDEGRVVDNKRDITKARLACFESGAKIKIEEAFFGLGGGACNTAVAFSRLGLKSGVVAKVGKDKEAEKVFEDLRKEGVDTTLIDQDKKSVTGFSFIAGTKGAEKEHTAFVYRGANDELIVTEPLLSRVRTSWFYVCSLSGGNWPLILKNVCEPVRQSKHKPGSFKKSAGIRLAWNPGYTQIEAGKRGIEKYLDSCDVLILNKDEAIELALSDSKNIKSESQLKNPEFLLRIIQGWGPEMVVITCGDAGAYVIYDQQVHFRKAKKVRAADTTGAGDAFGASFVAGLSMFKNDIERALKLAVINSASVVTEVGAQKGLLRAKSLLKL